MIKVEFFTRKRYMHMQIDVDADAARILDFLKAEDPPEQADVIFILGGSSVAPVVRAAQLYKDGYAPNIAFVSIGGRFGGDHVWGVPEHIKYKDVLNDLGVPDKSILSAGLTTNTLDEAKQAIPFLKENGVNAEKIILVARPMHQLMAWATFNKPEPAIKFINCPADEPDPADTELSRLVAEIDRLIVYGNKGDLSTVTIPAEILISTEKIRDTYLG